MVASRKSEPLVLPRPHSAPLAARVVCRAIFPFWQAAPCAPKIQPIGVALKHKNRLNRSFPDFQASIEAMCAQVPIDFCHGEERSDVAIPVGEVHCVNA